ncbi:MAG TPA: hypothetical protein VGK90_11545 [Rhizomicrobium sp.]|jgi:hypothetical protein
MDKITQTLLGGAALCALATAPAMAGGAPNLHVFALHDGHVIHKTRLTKTGHREDCSRLCTLTAISTAVPASDLHSVVKLAATYYTYYDSGSFCNSSEKQKVKLAKMKTQYAKLGTSTETYSGYCSTAPTVFYGDTYDLTKKSGEGKTDSFVSTLIGKNIHYNGGTYNIKTKFEVIVSIGQ